MPLETGDTIADLNPLWPLGSDPKSQGDDHLRLIKRAVQGNSARNTGDTFTGTVTLNFDNPTLRFFNPVAIADEEQWSVGSTTATALTIAPLTAAGAGTASRVTVRRAGNQVEDLEVNFGTTGTDVSFPGFNSVATRGRGDARWTLQATMSALLDVLQTNGGITGAQKAAILGASASLVSDD